MSMHDLAIEAWRRTQTEREAADELGRGIARVARIAAARHLALRITGTQDPTTERGAA
jgi:hypothetical protein